MRPDKPGCYWWLDNRGYYRIAEFNNEMMTFDYCDTGLIVSQEMFENSICFVQWVLYDDIKEYLIL